MIYKNTILHIPHYYSVLLSVMVHVTAIYMCSVNKITKVIMIQKVPLSISNYRKIYHNDSLTGYF